MSDQNLFARAQQRIPGGVNSPVRAFKAVGGEPIFIKSAEGAYLISEDDKKYLDYFGSWGPMIAGHTHPKVVKAVMDCIEQGLSFGTPTLKEIKLAEKICSLMPTIEQIRMVNSGTEATMSAIRLARGFTARQKIIKFAGCYHGHADSLLIEAGSGILTLGLPSSAGVPNSTIEHTLVAEFNSLISVEAWFKKFPTDIAAIIIEPVAGNMNCVPPIQGFLTGLRDLCDQYGSLLIFDEVMTGFRIALGGAEEVYGVKPDLVTLGKIIGGGMPVGAFGGHRDIMQYLAPVGPVYQAGTLSGNPVAMAAGLATLELLSEKNFYEDLAKKTQILTQGLQALALANGIPFKTHTIGSMFGLFFTTEDNVVTYADVKKCQVESFKRFFHAMLERGIYLAPSAFEAGFVSAAHTLDDIEKTITAAEQAFAHLKHS